MKTIRSDIYNLFQEKNILLTRNKGQHYLKSEEILEKLKTEAIQSVSDNIIEIGSGAAVLTIKLAETKKNIISYEIDKGVYECIKHLNSEFKNLTIINADFLKDFLPSKDLIYSVIANIPYNITSKIIKKIFTLHNRPQRAVLMVQKEFAKKITSESHKTAQTVFLNTATKTKTLFQLSKNDFFPKPKVDSTVIEILPLDAKTDLRHYYTFLQSVFSFKNKNLSNWFKKNKIIPSKQIPEFLLKEKINMISPDHFLAIFKKIEKQLKKN